MGRQTLFSARIDLDGIHVGGHAWLRFSIRLPRWYGLRVERKRQWRRYEYEVVTMNGHGIHGRPVSSVREAKRRAKVLAQNERQRAVKLGPYEIQRIEHVREGLDWPRRYWMRERRWRLVGRWVPWDTRRDENVRRPDWIYA